MNRKLILCLAAAAAFSGCEKKAEGQSVAIVNDEEITASELNAELASAKLPAGVAPTEARARILQGLIDRHLLTEQARKDRVDQSPEFITRQRQMTDQLLIEMLASRQMSTIKLPTETEIATFQAKQPQAFAKREVWKLGQLQYDTPADPSVMNKITQTKTLDQLAAVLTANRIPFQRGANQLITSAIPQEMYARLAGLTPGEPFILPYGSRSIASSIETRAPALLSESAARTEAVNMMRHQNATQALQNRLKELRKSAKIQYKNGFSPPTKT